MKETDFENALGRIVDKRNERIIVLEGRIAKQQTVIGWLLFAVLGLLGGIAGAAFFAVTGWHL